jgi:hypothetical protein
MRLTTHEIMLIGIVITALLVGAAVKQYRHARLPSNPIPEASLAP